MRAALCCRRCYRQCQPPPVGRRRRLRGMSSSPAWPAVSQALTISTSSEIIFSIRWTLSPKKTAGGSETVSDVTRWRTTLSTCFNQFSLLSYEIRRRRFCFMLHTFISTNVRCKTNRNKSSQFYLHCYWTIFCLLEPVIVFYSLSFQGYTNVRDVIPVLLKG